MKVSQWWRRLSLIAAALLTSTSSSRRHGCTGAIAVALRIHSAAHHTIRLKVGPTSKTKPAPEWEPAGLDFPWLIFLGLTRDRSRQVEPLNLQIGRLVSLQHLHLQLWVLLNVNINLDAHSYPSSASICFAEFGLEQLFFLDPSVIQGFVPNSVRQRIGAFFLSFSRMAVGAGFIGEGF